MVSPDARSFDAGEREEFRLLLEEAVREDGPDVTSEALLAPAATLRGSVVARQPCRVAGLPAVAAVCAEFGLDCSLLVDEGADLEAEAAAAAIEGNARKLLGCERILLNFLSRLSGVATLTRRYAERFHPTPVYDTRKTTPGWRRLQKYAVRIGGGRNHRRGLDDQILIKDNHFAALAAAGEHLSIAAIVERARRYRGERPDRSGLRIEVEVETMPAFREAVSAGADIVMLDNWRTAPIIEALAWLGERGRRRVEIELSGGMTLDRAPELARLGADRVSVGALTHSAAAVDFALDIRLPAA